MVPRPCIEACKADHSRYGKNIERQGARMRTYYLAKRMNDNLVQLFCAEFRDLWTRGRKRGESRRCLVTGTYIKSGDWAWRPITNGNNRMDRISDKGIEQLERIAATERGSKT